MTEYLNLETPETSDAYDIGVHNSNAIKIDAAAKDLNTKVTRMAEAEDVCFTAAGWSGNTQTAALQTKSYITENDRPVVEAMLPTSETDPEGYYDECDKVIKLETTAGGIKATCSDIPDRDLYFTVKGY